MNVKLRVLIIGGGSIGERHVRCFLQTGECEASLCEMDAVKRERLAATYPLRDCFADFDELPLGDFDIVVVATPAPFHIQQSLAAARAGCHVLCEKPLSNSFDGIQELIDTLRTKKRIGATAFTMRSLSSVRRIKEWLDQGTIGKPQYAVSNIAQHFPTVRPDYQRYYFAKKSMGGGTLFDMCPHQFNLLELYLGPEQDVSCMTGRLVLDGIETDDTATISIRYRSGALAQLNAVMFGRNFRYDFEIHGAEGSIVYDRTHETIALHTDGTPLSPPARTETFAAARDDAYVEQSRHFLAATRSEEVVACTLEEGWQTLRAVLAAQRSAETGHCERVE
jgi:predicted dehydrogenase